MYQYQQHAQKCALVYFKLTQNADYPCSIVCGGVPTAANLQLYVF